MRKPSGIGSGPPIRSILRCCRGSKRKWQSLPRFQRTRGVLRLLALWVAHNYQEEHRKATGEPLISVGLAPMQNPTFRAAVFEQLGGDGLEIPVTTDIIGKADAHAVRLDREADDAVKKAQLPPEGRDDDLLRVERRHEPGQGRCHRAGDQDGASSARTPTLADLDNVLEGLATTCYYLNWDRKPLSLRPNRRISTRFSSAAAARFSRRSSTSVSASRTQKLFDKHTVDSFQANRPQVTRRHAATTSRVGRC